MAAKVEANHIYMSLAELFSPAVRPSLVKGTGVNHHMEARLNYTSQGMAVNQALLVNQVIAVNQAMAVNQVIAVNQAMAVNQGIRVNQGITVNQVMAANQVMAVNPSYTLSSLLVVAKRILTHLIWQDIIAMLLLEVYSNPLPHTS